MSLVVNIFTFKGSDLTRSSAAWRTGADFEQAKSAPVRRVRLQRLVRRLHHLPDSPKDTEPADPSYAPTMFAASAANTFR